MHVPVSDAVALVSQGAPLFCLMPISVLVFSVSPHLISIRILEHCCCSPLRVSSFPFHVPDSGGPLPALVFVHFLPTVVSVFHSRFLLLLVLVGVVWPTKRHPTSFPPISSC